MKECRVLRKYDNHVHKCESSYCISRVSVEYWKGHYKYWRQAEHKSTAPDDLDLPDEGHKQSKLNHVFVFAAWYSFFQSTKGIYP